MSKKLYRSTNQKVFGGVCGGIAEYFDIDPVIVRILFVIAVFGWGVSFLIYILALFIVPKNHLIYQNAYNNYDQNNSSQNANNQEYASYDYNNYVQEEKISNKTKNFFGITLIVLGAIILLDDLVELIRIEYVFPSLLIIAGFYIISSNRKSNEE
jgi:phage shock protein C